jgi:membrane-bound metal-dependent hydrolase YbcI (DUF457 family)
VLLWFVGTAVLSVWYVFTDPRFDYRLLVVGSLLPDVVDVWSRTARWAHSLTVAVGVLAAVMLVTTGRKPVRRLLLGLPIGMLMHLVWDLAFASTTVFWWPFSGDWGDVRLPSLARGWWSLPMELAGVAMLWWIWKRFGLADAERRRQFVRTGVLREGTV